LNALSPAGFSLYGGIYNYCKVLAAQITVKGTTGVAGFTSNMSISWGDMNYTPSVGTATTAGYTYPAFNVSNGTKQTPLVYSQLATVSTPIIKTLDILKSDDENEDCTTTAGGGPTSPTSLWYFNVLTQPMAAAQNQAILLVTLKQLCEFYDATAL